jgi:serine/threonine-protein kinase
MTPERWQRAKELFNSALELEANERSVFLDQECAGDNELRREVESLLESDDETDSFMESPAVEDAADSLAGDEQKLEAGQKIGRYEIVSLAGEGGMGEVYLAHDSRLGRKVALKLLPSYLSNDKGRLRRFEQEARSASALSHPNVCMIHEVGEMADESRPYIAMEFVDGITLRERLGQGEIKLGKSLDIAIQVASALTAAHEAGITHRDIKPENIMIRRDGYVKVLDFGLAKLAEQQRQTSRIITNVLSKSGVKTEPGVVLGTAQYMSPEQARGQAVDARTDIWALGAVIYEMAAGRAPFEGDTTSDIIAGVLEREPVPIARYAPKLPENVEWIISKALRKDKEERYQTSKEILTDLRSVKQRLEFEIELERSTPPNKASGAIAAALSGEQAAHRSAAPNVTPTDEVSKGRRTSSAEYVIREVKQHKLGAGLGLTVLLAAIVGLSYFFYFVPSTKAAINSIAVLPFANVSNDPNTEYLSDGISESLINNLSQLPQLKVIARSSAFTYKGKEIDLQEVAKNLGVQAIVTGRVIQRGDNLQISAEMMNASDRTQIWGEQYSRRAADLQTVQAEISKELGAKLRLKLTGEEEKRLTKRYTDNSEAYQFYLKGRYYWGKENEEGFKKAIENFNQAIATDPHYALAYSGLADSYGTMGDYGYLDPKEAFPKAKFAAQKALEIDDTLAEAHASLAKVKELDWDWSGAESEYKRALELNPNYAAAHLYYSSYLSKMGRHDEAISEGKRAVELDPLSLSIKANMGIAYFLARRYDQAMEVYQKILEMDSNFNTAHFMLAIVYSVKGMYKESIAECQKIIELEGSNPVTLVLLAQTYALSGKKDEAQKILDQVKSSKEYVAPHDIAQLYAALGDKEEAFKWLEKAYEARDGQLGYFKVIPLMDSLRSDPRFQDLLRRVGLTP